MISAPAKGRKSQQKQRFRRNVAYHREIGREATAQTTKDALNRLAYHREIGREATAWCNWRRNATLAYHREIGREATALRGLLRRS